MKTAIQELIDWIIYQGSKRTVPESEIIDLAIVFLEKEKEQIIDAYETAIERPIENYAEQYYNETYQNK